MAYSRYSIMNKTTNTNGDRVLKSTLYPDIPKHENDIYVVTQLGDTLYAIAKNYYGSVNYYWIIAQGNVGIGNGTQDLPPGVQLRIPQDLENILKDYQDLNNK